MSSHQRSKIRIRPLPPILPIPPPQDQRVHAALQIQILLQATQRHEDGAHRTLLRPQRELAEHLRPRDGPHVHAHRASALVLPCVQRLDRKGGRPLEPHEQRAASRCADVRGERRADQGVAAARTARRDAVKPPETIVDAVHLDAGRAAAAVLIAHDAFNGKQRADAAERRLRRDGVGKLFAKESRRHDGPIGPAEALQHEAAQARAD